MSEWWMTINEIYAKATTSRQEQIDKHTSSLHIKGEKRFRWAAYQIGANKDAAFAHIYRLWRQRFVLTMMIALVIVWYGNDGRFRFNDLSWKRICESIARARCPRVCHDTQQQQVQHTLNILHITHFSHFIFICSLVCHAAKRFVRVLCIVIICAPLIIIEKSYCIYGHCHKFVQMAILDFLVALIFFFWQIFKLFFILPCPIMERGDAKYVHCSFLVIFVSCCVRFVIKKKKTKKKLFAREIKTRFESNERETFYGVLQLTDPIDLCKNVYVSIRLVVFFMLSSLRYCICSAMAWLVFLAWNCWALTLFNIALLFPFPLLMEFPLNCKGSNEWQSAVR